MAHEVGHTVAALARDVKISIPFLIPNGQLGTFGSITQIKSLPKTRRDLFDVAIAGPIAGGTVAGTLFFYGLALSLNGDPNTLLPVPNELFNGSLLLGSVAQLFPRRRRADGEGRRSGAPPVRRRMVRFFSFFFLSRGDETTFRARDDFSRPSLFRKAFLRRPFDLLARRAFGGSARASSVDDKTPTSPTVAGVAARRPAALLKRKRGGSGARLPAPRGGALP
jgi:hypothetical protein